MRLLNYENGSGGMRAAQQRLTQNNDMDFTQSQRNPFPNIEQVFPWTHLLWIWDTSTGNI